MYEELFPESHDRVSGWRVELSVHDDEAAIEKARALWHTVRVQFRSYHHWELVRGAMSLDEFRERLETMPGIVRSKVQEARPS